MKTISSSREWFDELDGRSTSGRSGRRIKRTSVALGVLIVLMFAACGQDRLASTAWPVCTRLIDQVSVDSGRKLELTLAGVAGTPGGGEKIICGASRDDGQYFGWDVSDSGAVTQVQGPPLPAPQRVTA